MKFDLNLTILIIILLLNVWSIFVKSTCGETVEGFIPQQSLHRLSKSIINTENIVKALSSAAYWDKFHERVRFAMIGMCMQP